MLVLDAPNRDALSAEGGSVAGSSLQMGLDLLIAEGLSRGGDKDVAVFLNGQRVEGRVESWAGGLVLKSMYQQAENYATEPHANLHLNAAKYGKAANFVVAQDPNFTTTMWDGINEKNLETVVDGVTQKARVAATPLELKEEEVAEFAYEIFVRIAQDIPIVDDVKVPFASEVRSRILKERKQALP